MAIKFELETRWDLILAIFKLVVVDDSLTFVVVNAAPAKIRFAKYGCRYVQHKLIIEIIYDLKPYGRLKMKCDRRIMKFRKRLLHNRDCWMHSLATLH